MFRNNMGIHLNRSFFKLSLTIFKDLTNGKYQVLIPGEYKDHHETDINIPPSINLPLELGQQLIDQLWNLGYRPSEGISSRGQNKAMKEHIKDLRNITYNLLNIK